MADNIDIVEKVGAFTKFKYKGGSIAYRTEEIRIFVNGDKITVRFDYLHPKDQQASFELLFGQLSEQYGQANAEDYIEYLINNDFFLLGPGSASNPLITQIGGTNLDLFSRIRVGGTGQRLDVEFLYDKQPGFFDEVVNNGTVTHDANARDLSMAIANANNGTYALMRSHPVPYTPGNAQLIEMTGVLDYADIGGGNFECFLRTNVTGSVTEQVVDSADWVLPYNFTPDPQQSLIFFMTFQSLKVGSIVFGFNHNKDLIPVAQIDNDNIRKTGYWQTASLPVYYRIYNDATYTYMELGYGDESNAIGFRYKIAANASATMRAICCTVKSEAGRDLADMPGLPRAIDMGVTTKSVSTTLIPLLSIRARSTFNSITNLGIALPKSYSLITDNDIRYVVLLNPTLTGATFGNVNTNNSMMEYDVAATAISGGIIVDSGYIATTAKNTGASGGGLLGKTVLWKRLSSTLNGILAIAAVRAGATNGATLAGFKWDEIR